MKRYMTRLGLCCGLIMLAQCGPGAVTPENTPLSPTAVPTIGTNPIATPSTVPTELPGAPTADPPPTMTTIPAQATPNAKQELVRALERAVEELRAAEAAGTLAEAKAHAEGAVNLLVGKYGRWYGDGDGDGVKLEPADGRGVLPGEIVPQGGADTDNAQRFPAGLALLAAGTDTDSPMLNVLLGDVSTWRTKPRAGYDAIESAVEGAGTSPGLDSLKGAAPRAVGFARLILTSAQTVGEAQAPAASGVKELEEALVVVRR